MRFGLLGASGAIGQRILVRLSGESVLVLRRSASGQVLGDNSLLLVPNEDQSAAIAEQIDVLLDAGPSGANAELISQLLARGIPVVSLGHLPSARKDSLATQLYCAGALPGILAAVPLLLTDQTSPAASISCLRGPISRSAAADIVAGARRDLAVQLRRDFNWPQLNQPVDLVGYADENTAVVDQLRHGQVEWWNAWAGQKFRDALFASAHHSVDEASAMLAAASLTMANVDYQIVASASTADEAVLVQIRNIAQCCAATAIEAARRSVGRQAQPGAVPMVEYFRAELPDLLRTVVAHSSGVITASQADDEEGEL